MAPEAKLPHPALPWSQESKSLLAALGADPESGLSRSEAARRLEINGENRLKYRSSRSLLSLGAAQFRSIIVVLLVVAASLAFALGDFIEGIAILAVIATNAAIGFFTELRAVRSMEALRELTHVTVTVRRDGDAERLPAEQLVLGDIVTLEAGDVVAADLRLTAAAQLQADESTLTGESVASGKTPEVLARDTILADRENMLFSGSSITRGTGEAVVVATGLDTELGKISSLIDETGDDRTPLEERLDTLGRKLVWVTFAIATLTAFAGIRSGKDIYLMIETSIALAVAAIPEGLPIVATIALARGMWRMAQKNALINRLSAVETLGATSVICTDKTGTLTENRMTFVRLLTSAGEHDFTQPLPGVAREALRTCTLCNNATPTVGDPLETALLDHRTDGGSPPPREHEVPFDSREKMMATFHAEGASFRVSVKGAPERVIAACDSEMLADGKISTLDESRRQFWMDENSRLAEAGFRIIATAHKQADEIGLPPYENLTLTGLAALLDPPRSDVRDALQQCRSAGIRVVVATGDQAATAINVAQCVGLPGTTTMLGSEFGGRGPIVSTDIFARVSPEQKLDIIAAHQAEGSIVAMTGDGVNDAPALKKADIGIAMGLRGTEVAKEASDMVLKDDAFASIVSAVRQGRIIFNNIRKFVVYLMSCNLSEILVVGLAAAADAPLPLLPLQILFLNLVTDVFPALALGFSEGSGDVMSRPPRPSTQPLLTRHHWWKIIGFSSVIAASVLGAFATAIIFLQLPVAGAVTISFYVLAAAQVLHVFNMADRDAGILNNEIVRNPYVWAAVALCASLLALAASIPAASDALGIVALPPAGWILIGGASSVPIALGLAIRLFSRLLPTRP